MAGLVRTRYDITFDPITQDSTQFNIAEIHPRDGPKLKRQAVPIVFTEDVRSLRVAAADDIHVRRDGEPCGAY